MNEVVAGLLPTLRLLELTRRQRTGAPRILRLWLVTVHLVVPIVGWLAAAFAVQLSLQWQAVVGAALPLVIALAMAWFRYPAPYVHRLEPPRPSELATLAAAAVMLVLLVWFSGRPTGDGKSAGILWGHSHSFNNIRTWIEPLQLTGQELDHPDQ